MLPRVVADVLVDRSAPVMFGCMKITVLLLEIDSSCPGEASNVKSIHVNAAHCRNVLHTFHHLICIFVSSITPRLPSLSLHMPLVWCGVNVGDLTTIHTFPSRSVQMKLSRSETLPLGAVLDITCCCSSEVALSIPHITQYVGDL